MNETNTTVKVFQVNDMEWWAGGCTAEELLAAYVAETGCTRVQATGDANGLPYEVSDEGMNALMIRCLDEGEVPTGEVITFREHLDNLIAEGQQFPCLFAAED